MNICMFSPFSQRAPSSHRLFSFAKELTSQGHNVSILLPSFDRYSDFKVEQYTSRRFKIVSPLQINTRNSAINMGVFAFSSALKSLRSNFDIVHILKPTPITLSAYGNKFFFKKPIVQDIDDLDHKVMHAEGHSAAKIWLMEKCERIIPKYADGVVVCSSSLMQMYSEMGLAQKIVRISNGVCVKDFDVDVSWTIKKQYNLNDKVVVYLGSLNNENQIIQLLQSMKIIVSERKDVSCLIIGDGSAKSSLQRYAYLNGLKDFVVFTGKVPYSKVPTLLSVSDIGYACFPELDYLRYASNIKVFEYMAAGCIPIVSPQGDLPFYVNYGKAGIIVKPDVSAISRGLFDILSDEKRRRLLSQNSKKYVLNFDWSVLSKKLINFYKELI